MISEAELRRWAGKWATDPMVVDLDYVLGCFLSQWYKDKEAAKLRFKGKHNLKQLLARRSEFEHDWKRNLSRLIPTLGPLSFKSA